MNTAHCDMVLLEVYVLRRLYPWHEFASELDYQVLSSTCEITGPHLVCFVTDTDSNHLHDVSGDCIEDWVLHNSDSSFPAIAWKLKPEADWQFIANI